jgi:hypothetical protein
MAKKGKRPGTRLFKFVLFGNEYDVRCCPAGHKKFDNEHDVYGMCYMEDREIYIRDVDTATLEQRQTALLHEIQHLIEDHYSIDFERAAEDNKSSEARTDHISLGWLYVIRGCPQVIDFVRQKNNG